jgi:hypothetical protein
VLALRPSSPHAGQRTDVLLVLLLQHAHDVVDGDLADEPAGVVHHGREIRRYFSTGVGHLLLVLVDADLGDVLADLGQGCRWRGGRSSR